MSFNSLLTETINVYNYVTNVNDVGEQVVSKQLLLSNVPARHNHIDDSETIFMDNIAIHTHILVFVPYTNNYKEWQFITVNGNLFDENPNVFYKIRAAHIFWNSNSPQHIQLECWLQQKD